MAPAFRAVLLRKHEVQYFRCASCGLLKTEKPHWLAEAYTSAIADTDTGLVARNLGNRALLEPVLHRLFGGGGRFLDLAGGHGLLTRLLRDVGIDCYTTDPYCENLFAKGFEPRDGFRADALFAFEVLEHLEDPLTFLREAFRRYGSRTLFFSTLHYGEEVPPLDWWYYGFDSGTHITFYQLRTLARLAQAVGLGYHQLGGLHLFTDRTLSAADRLLLDHARVRRLYAARVRRRRRAASFTWADHLAAVERLRATRDE
jgi:hypothetical protein